MTDVTLPDHVLAWLQGQGDISQAITKLVEDKIRRQAERDEGLRSARKAGRLIALLAAQERGLLDGLTLQQIADLTGVGHRSTAMRDLRLLDQVIAYRDHFLIIITVVSPFYGLCEIFEKMATIYGVLIS